MTKRKRSPLAERGFAVETYQQATPGKPVIRQVIIKTEEPIGPGGSPVILFRRDRNPQQDRLKQLRPLGRGIAVGILARPGVHQIKILGKRAFVTIDRKADFGHERDAAERIVGAQIAYFS